MIIFPEPLTHSYPSEESAAACVKQALEHCATFLASTEGAAALEAIESQEDGAFDAIEQIEQAATAAQEANATDVEVTFADGSTTGLFSPTFMDAALLGTSQVKEMVRLQSSLNDDEVDARVIAGALAFENQTGFEDAMLWLHSLHLAGALTTES